MLAGTLASLAAAVRLYQASFGAQFVVRPDAGAESVAGAVRQLERGEVSPLDAIDTLLAEELTVRESRRIKTALVMARLTAVKTLAGFDFSFQPSLDRNRILAKARERGLADAITGEREAYDRLFSLVYAELHRLARQQLYRNARGATLGATTLLDAREQAPPAAATGPTIRAYRRPTDCRRG